MTFEDLFSYPTQQLAFQAKQSSRENWDEDDEVYIQNHAKPRPRDETD
jgi:hypothetical protein